MKTTVKVEYRGDTLIGVVISGEQFPNGNWDLEQSFVVLPDVGEAKRVSFPWACEVEVLREDMVQ